MQATVKKTGWAVILLAGLMSLTGCLVAAAAAGGYVAGEELSEDDGDFDPLDEIDDD